MTLSPQQRRRRRAIVLRKKRRRSKDVRDVRRAAGVCINNPWHGLAAKGGRCSWCWDQKITAQKDKQARDRARRETQRKRTKP